MQRRSDTQIWKTYRIVSVTEIVWTHKKTSAGSKRKISLLLVLQEIVRSNSAVALSLSLSKQLLFLRQLRELRLIERLESAAPLQHFVRGMAVWRQVDVQQGVLPVSRRDGQKVEASDRANLAEAEMLGHQIDHLRCDTMRLSNGFANFRPGFPLQHGRRQIVRISVVTHNCTHDSLSNLF